MERYNLLMVDNNLSNNQNDKHDIDSWGVFYEVMAIYIPTTGFRETIDKSEAKTSWPKLESGSSSGSGSDQIQASMSAQWHSHSRKISLNLGCGRGGFSGYRSFSVIPSSLSNFSYPKLVTFWKRGWLSMPSSLLSEITLEAYNP